MSVDFPSVTWAVVDRNRRSFLGTSFLLRRVDHALTAAHVVAGRHLTDLGVARGGMDLADALHVERIEAHPTADLALLHLEPYRLQGRPMGYISNLLSVSVPQVGEAFTLSGWNDLEADRSIETLPAVRVQRGTVERISYCVRPPHSYHCAELSLNVRGGLSGGPLLSDRGQGVVLGVAAGSERTERPLESYEKVVEGNRVVTERVEVIHTGIAVLFNAGDPWWADQFGPGMFG